MTEEPPRPVYDEARIRAQLQRWKERLLDLSKANPLLGINRSRVTKLHITGPAPGELFERLTANEEALSLPLPKKIASPRGPRALGDGPGTAIASEELPTQWSLTPGDIEFEGTAEELSRKIRRIHDNARTTIEERGVTTLYVTFGILEWDDPLLGSSRTPIWMVPAHLDRSGQMAPLRLSLADEEMQVNPALELYLRERHKVALPAAPEDPSPEALQTYLEAIKQRVDPLGWTVESETWLSTFTFEALVLYQDLTAMADIAVQNRLVAALARAGAEPGGSEALGDDLDSLPPEEAPIPVLPTDSSQLEALALAAGGRHVVIHGPPGTGKSQTITSLIADALGRGKKVLFVSAKMAALEVVYRRLRERGLADFCLEAHSTKAGKAKIIEELRRTLELDLGARDVDLDQDHEELVRVRQALNAYVAALHRRFEPLGLTVYRGIGKVAQLRGAPEIRFQLPWEHVLEVTPAQLAEVRDAIEDLAGQATVFDVRATHPWRGLSAASAGVASREAIEGHLVAIDGALGHAMSSLTALGWADAEQLSLQRLDEDARALETYSSCSALADGWRSGPVETLLDRVRALEEGSELARGVGERRQRHEATVNVSPAEAVAMLSPLNDRFRSWWSQLTPAYWSWRKPARAIFRPGVASGRSEMITALRQAEEYIGQKRELEARAPILSPEVGPLRVEDPETLSAAAKTVRAAMELRAARLPLTRLPDPSENTRAAAAAILSVLPSRNERVRAALEEIDRVWPEGFAGKESTAAVPFDVLRARIREVRAAMPKMAEWMLLHRTVERARALGLGPLIESLGTVSVGSARAVFDRRFYVHWTSAAIDQAPELERFLGSKRQDLISRFQELDDKIRVSVAKHVRAVAGEPAALIRRAGSIGTASEVGTLRRELGKRKRIKPLRRLFNEIPNVLQALKPCMLMSPISVSTYLKPGALHFDLIVFDEASQMPTQEAVPAILRADQVVVAGDTKQLPPTTFFMSSFLSGDEEYEDEELESLEPLESLLDDAVAVVPHFDEAYLRWHYRSRDERLIAFSNYLFYEGRLHTFPSASTTTDGRGVEFVHVPDGVYGRGKDRRNPREARVVAETIVRELEIHPHRSIGVVAMSLSQREAIEDAIKEELADRPDLAAIWDRESVEPSFIKALENVQGDERDTMIISVGYGRDIDGALAYNFGPLNVHGGERRLNVLVTRAKWHTILVTSLRSSDLAGVNPNNKGASALRSFITYAETGELPRPPAIDTEAETNDFEDSVREALIERGFAVDAQVGASRFRVDLGIRDRRDPTRYLLGVECDGATYHGTRTARDRDLLRHEVLRQMGWRLHRLWSTAWFRDPDATISDVLRSIELAEKEPVERSIEAPRKAFIDLVITPEDGKPSAAPVQPTRTYEPGVPYQRYAGRSRDRRDLLEGSRRPRLTATLIEMVKVEWPIMDEVLLERLREVHGVGRAGDNIRENFDRALKDAMWQKSISVEFETPSTRVISLPDAAVTRFRIPGDDVQRSIEEIPKVEIAIAALHLVEDQFGMQRDAIPARIANIFGFSRARAPSADRIREVIDELIEAGRLRAQGPNLYLA